MEGGWRAGEEAMGEIQYLTTVCANIFSYLTNINVRNPQKLAMNTLSVRSAEALWYPKSILSILKLIPDVDTTELCRELLQL